MRGNEISLLAAKSMESIGIRPCGPSPPSHDAAASTPSGATHPAPAPSVEGGGFAAGAASFADRESADPLWAVPEHDGDPAKGTNEYFEAFRKGELSWQTHLKANRLAYRTFFVKGVGICWPSFPTLSYRLSIKKDRDPF